MVFIRNTSVYRLVKMKFSIGDNESKHRIGSGKLSFAQCHKWLEKQDLNLQSNVLKKSYQIEAFISKLGMATFRNI